MSHIFFFLRGRGYQFFKIITFFWNVETTKTYGCLKGLNKFSVSEIMVVLIFISRYFYDKPSGTENTSTFNVLYWGFYHPELNFVKSNDLLWSTVAINCIHYSNWYNYLLCILQYLNPFTASSDLRDVPKKLPVLHKKKWSQSFLFIYLILEFLENNIKHWKF